MCQISEWNLRITFLILIRFVAGAQRLKLDFSIAADLKGCRKASLILSVVQVPSIHSISKPNVGMAGGITKCLLYNISF